MFDQHHHPMDPQTKTILWVGAAAAAVGVAFALWPKSSAASAALPATNAPTAAGTWTPTTTLQQGVSYMVAQSVASVAADRVSAAAALSNLGWANGAVLYFPNDPLAANWPTSMPKPIGANGQPDTSATLVFMGTWTGAPTTIAPGQGVTALQFNG